MLSPSRRLQTYSQATVSPWHHRYFGCIPVILSPDGQVCVCVTVMRMGLLCVSVSVLAVVWELMVLCHASKAATSIPSGHHVALRPSPGWLAVCHDGAQMRDMCVRDANLLAVCISVSSCYIIRVDCAFPCWYGCSQHAPMLQCRRETIVALAAII